MKKKVIAIVIGLVAIALAVVIGIGSAGFCNWEISEWFNHWGKGEKEEPVLTGETDFSFDVGGGMVLAESEIVAPVQFLCAELPASAYAVNGVSETAENAYVVSATVQPDSLAQNTDVEWSLSWKDGSWVTSGIIQENLDDYVQLSGTTGQYTTVSCLRAFGMPVILTVKCKDAPEITNSIQIDYVSRLHIRAIYTNEDKDYLGNSTNIKWDTSATNLFTLELGSTDSCMNLCPSRIEYEYSDYYTILNTYTLDLGIKGNGQPICGSDGSLRLFSVKPMAASLSPIYIEDYTQTLGTFDCEREIFSGGIHTFDIPNEVRNKFAMNKDGICSFLYNPASGDSRRYLNQEIDNGYLSSYQTRLDFRSCTACRDDKSDFISSIYLCDLTLKFNGERDSFEYTTSINLKNVYNNAKITGVDLNESGIVF